jgi:hypothetical protein
MSSWSFTRAPRPSGKKKEEGNARHHQHDQHCQVGKLSDVVIPEKE